MMDRSIPKPGFPPYYSPDFFTTIRNAKDDTSLNITMMTTSEWSTFLVEENVTMTTLPDLTREFTPCKAELAQPSNDWQQSWSLARMKGLGPEHTSFLWKLVHLLLPIKERLHRLSPGTSPTCSLCNQNLNEDMVHAFLSCDYNQGAGDALAQVLSQHLPSISMVKILRLELGELSEELEFPLVWFTAPFLLAMWERRSGNKRIRCYEIRAEMEGKIYLQRETSFREHVPNVKLLCDRLATI